MGIPIIGTIIEGIGKITGLIDEVTTTDEERLTLKTQLLLLQTNVVSAVLDYEQKITEAKRDIIVSETKADSWITRSWRPIVMLVLTGIVLYGFVAGVAIPADMWTVIKIGLGGYIAGRSAEKIVPSVVGAMKKAEE